MALPKKAGQFSKAPIRPPYRTVTVCLAIIAVFLLGYRLWTPGKLVTDGRHDLKKNGIWLGHGWLGDDTWFQKYHKNPQIFRDPVRILDLKKTLLAHHMKDLFPHLAPCRPSGQIAGVDSTQTRQFLAIMDEFRVIPWVGGVLDVQAFPEFSEWRKQFIRSILELFASYPLLAGIHVNIEPLPSGYEAFIELLRELKRQLPPNKILSVAAYPPPTIWQWSKKVHWDKAYYEKIAQQADQMVVMMYDTGIRLQKPYQHLMASWTAETLEWSGNSDVLLGVPAYDDEGVGYHDPHVENLETGLSGIHSRLVRYQTLPGNYKGIAVYSEWEMEQREWDFLKTGFLQK